MIHDLKSEIRQIAALLRKIYKIIDEVMIRVKKT